MLTKDDVKKIAKLARLALNEAEIDKFTQQLGSILEHAEMLKEVDTEGVEPIAQITGLTNVKGDDTIAAFDSVDDLLKSSPQPTKNRMMKVKSVF